MTPQAALLELLDRLAVQQGATVHVGNDELNSWPAGAVATMKSARLLVKARYASSIVCPGCEEQCPKPVEIHPAEKSRPTRALIVCNEPADLGLIPVELRSLEQWRITGEGLAGAVARLLGYNKPPEQDGTGKRWTLGLLKGKERKGAIKLSVESGITLAVAGHTVALAEILSHDGSGLAVDRDELLRLVDKPVNTPRYETSTARREARKLDTQAQYAAWRKAAKKLRRKPQGKSERWIAHQIAKSDIANKANAETIRKHLRQ